MAQTQQYDGLTQEDGTGLNAKPTWTCTAEGGNPFTFYSSASPATSHSIQGVFRAEKAAPPETGVNLPRAFLDAAAGGALAETTVTVSYYHRFSSVSTWGNPAASGSVDNEVVALVRATGTTFATNAWYEAGITNLDNVTTGTLFARKIAAGVTTNLTAVTPGALTFAALNANFNYPGFGYTGLAQPNTLAKVVVTAFTLAPGIVVLQVTISAAHTTGVTESVTAFFQDITGAPPGNVALDTGGFGGFAGTGNSSAGVFQHVIEFLLSADSNAFLAYPTDPLSIPPTIAADVFDTAASISVAAEGASAATLTIEPSFALEQKRDFYTHENPTDSGWVVTHPKFAESRRIFEFQWVNLTNTDATTLRTFFEARSAGVQAFTWTPPGGSAIKLCAANPEIQIEWSDINSRTARGVFIELVT